MGSFIIDSRYALPGSVSSSNFSVTSPAGIARTITLTGFEIPLTYYAINSNNVNFYILVGSTIYTCPVAVGTYDIFTGSLALQTALNTNGALGAAVGGTFAVSISQTTCTTSISCTNTAAAFSAVFNFSAHSISQLYSQNVVFGFNANVDVASVGGIVTSPNAVDMRGYSLLLVKSPTLGNRVIQSANPQPDQNVMLAVQVEAPPFSIINQTLTEPVTFTLPSSTSTIAISVTFQNNIPLSFNGANIRLFFAY